MIQHHSVVFSHSQQPPAQSLGRGRWGGGAHRHEHTVQLFQQKHRDSACEGRAGLDSVAHLVVDLKLLHHSQFHEHPEGGRDHGVDVQGEVVEGELVDAQLADEGDVGGLFSAKQKKGLGGGQRSGGGVPFGDDACKHGEGGVLVNGFHYYFLSDLIGNAFTDMNRTDSARAMHLSASLTRTT